jgi:tubulin gamma
MSLVDFLCHGLRLIPLQLFKRIVAQYDRLRKRNAFLDQYKKEPIFANDLTEFDDARAEVADLIAEYEAAESASYLDASAATEREPPRGGGDE